MDFAMDSEGEPIFCGRLAAIKYDGTWLCVEHYDTVAEQPKAGYVYRQGAS